LKTKDLFHKLPRNARILLIRLRSIGDCLLLTGPVRALKEHFPEFRISVVAEARFADCFDGNPDFSEVISLKRKTAAAQLMARRFHAILNLHGGPTSFAYSCMAWGRRIGAEQYQYRQLYNGLVPSVEPYTHCVDATLATFRWLGLPESNAPALRYGFHVREAAKMQTVMRGRKYVVIHPGAVLTTKRWAADRFAQVAQALQSEGFVIALTAGPGEDSVVVDVARNLPGAVILLGLTIAELAELIRGAKLYVGNDSGPMHLAAAVGTPTVAVWGSSDSRAWRPWGVASRVVQNPFECNPCPGYRCLVAETPLCIESVAVEQVIAAAKELLI
jgi:predicted lipopolysaccharide heptosyltransferase III